MDGPKPFLGRFHALARAARPVPLRLARERVEEVVVAREVVARRDPRLGPGERAANCKGQTRCENASENNGGCKIERSLFGSRAANGFLELGDLGAEERVGLRYASFQGIIMSNGPASPRRGEAVLPADSSVRHRLFNATAGCPSFRASPNYWLIVSGHNPSAPDVRRPHARFRGSYVGEDGSVPFTSALGGE